jgi:hypothetical protein
MGRGDGPGAHTLVRKIARFWALSILWTAAQACTADTGPSTCLNPQPLPPYCNGNSPGVPGLGGADASMGNTGGSSGSSSEGTEDAGSGATPPAAGADAAAQSDAGGAFFGVGDASVDTGTNPGVGGDASFPAGDASLDAPAGDAGPIDAAPTDATADGASSDAGHD